MARDPYAGGYYNEGGGGYDDGSSDDDSGSSGGGELPGNSGSIGDTPDPDPDPAPSPGGSSPPPSDVGGPGGSSPPAEDVGGTETVSESTSVSSSGGTNVISETVSGIGEFGADVREFQAETTPVRDAGRQTREALSDVSGVDIPSEREAAAATNEAVASGIGVSPRQARLDARSSIIGGLNDGADAVVDRVPGGERTVAGAATVAAVAEPTPFGEALLFGSGAAAGIGGATASNPEQGRDLVPESPFTQPELDVGEADQDVDEIGQPTNPTGSTSEVDVGEPRPVEVGVPESEPSEIEVPDGSGTGGVDLELQQAVGELIEREQTDRPTITREDLVDERGDPRQDPPSTRERQRREDLDVFERRFPGRENQIIGRGSATEFDDEFATVGDDVVGQGTDVTTGTGAGSGVGPLVPPFADVDTGTDTDPTQPGDTTRPPASGPGTDTPTDTDAPADTGTDTGQTTVTDTVVLQGSATVGQVADPASADVAAPNPSVTTSEPVEPTPANPSGFGRGDGRRRRPLLDGDGQEPDADLPGVAVDEGVVTNPTQSLDAISEDLQKMFDGGSDGP